MNLLITGAWKCNQEELKRLNDMGCTYVLMPNESDVLPCEYESIGGVICNGLFLHHPIEKFTALKYIQLTSAGYDRVPMDYVKEKGIKINNAAGVYSIPMAEFAIGGVLQLYKHSRILCENQKAHIWEKERDLFELYGKNVCIVGCGNVGTECAKRFSAFGCKVVGVDAYPAVKDFYEIIYPITELCKCLSEADIVILTLPLTNDTYHLIDVEKLTLMKKNSVLVNIARGKIVDEAALPQALDKGMLGAVLDVFEEEPLNSSSELWNRRNVIATPHNSFVGEGNRERLKAIIFKNIMEWTKERK